MSDPTPRAAHDLSPGTGAPRPRSPGAGRRLARGTARLALGTALAALACRPAPAPAQPPAPPPVRVEPPPPDPCADAPPPAEFAAARARVAELLRCGDGPRALAVHAENLRRDPQPRWAHALASLAIAEGTPDAARAVLVDLDRDGAARPVGLALLAIDAYERRGEARELAQAHEHFQAALARAPDDPHALGVALRHAIAVAAREPERLVLAGAFCRDRLAARARPPRDPVPSDSPNPARPADAADPDSNLRDDIADAGPPAPPTVTADDPAQAGAAVLAATCARVALLSEEPGEARRRFALALELDPTDVATRLRWAGVELAAGNDGPAAALYAAAAAAPSARDRYAAHLGLGVARTRLHDRRGAEAAYRAAAAARGLQRGDPPATYPPELQFNLGSLLAATDDPSARAEARALLQAYLDHPGADQPRRLRCQQLLLELRE